MEKNEKILVIYKKSKLELAKEFKDKKILELIKRDDDSISKYVEADLSNKECLSIVKKVFKRRLNVKYKYNISKDISKKYKLVVTVGGDGTFLWASKYIKKDIPIIGVNSSSTTSVGFYSCINGNIEKEIIKLEKEIYNNTIFKSAKTVNRISVSVNGKKLTDRVINEVLFSSTHPAGMSEFVICVPNRFCSMQRSSGIWISAPGGSTGANMSAGGERQDIDANLLQYIVREPIKNPLGTNKYSSSHGYINKKEKIKLLCKNRNAILSCDGTHTVFPVTIGDEIVIKQSKYPIEILGK